MPVSMAQQNAQKVEFTKPSMFEAQVASPLINPNKFNNRFNNKLNKDK